MPQHQAIDFVNGNNYKFFGDSILLEDGMLQNFHIKPGRIAMQFENKTMNTLTSYHKTDASFNLMIKNFSN